MSSLFPKSARPTRGENTGGSFSLVCFPLPFLGGNVPEETWNFWIFKSHLSQSTRRFSSLWWIILVGFSRCFHRYKVRCNSRMVAMDVSDIQRDPYGNDSDIHRDPYGNDSARSALLKAELQLRCLWVCLCS